MSHLAVNVLGTLHVVVEHRAVLLAGARQPALLAALVLGRGTVVSSDRLIDQVFDGEPPGDARNALQTCVTRLRQALGPAAGRIRTRSPGYLLDLPADAVDAERFAALLADRPGEGAQDVAARLDEALALWRGPAYAEFAAGFARGEAVRLEELRRTAQERRVEALLELGRVEDAVASAAGMVAAEPGRDRAVALLVTGLAIGGRAPEALAAYEAHRDWMRDELGLDPSPELRELHRRVLRGQLATPARSGELRQAGPARVVAPLVGQEDVLTRATELLATSRLVTLVGPGGVGKTRLAWELYTRVDAAWVDLAALTDPAAVPHAVAEAVGLAADPGTPLADTLRRWAGQASCLVVLDNCEHLLDAVAGVVATLLGGPGAVRVLATSRERIGVPGERPLVVPPLDEKPAVRLFLDRAAESGIAEIADDRLLDRITGVCRALDGLPLAIELAAARVGSLTVDDLADRLDARFELLVAERSGGGPRHRTLGAVIDWSYRLLPEPERLLFARLHVFAAGFDIAAAEAVTAGEGVPADQVAHLLGRLAERSMLTRPGHAGVGRYRMLDTLRRYAATRLPPDEVTRLRSRHAEYLVGLTEPAGAGLLGPDEERCARRLEDSLDDARAAWAWARENGATDLAVRLVAALTPYAYWRLRLDVLGWGEWAAQTVPRHEGSATAYAAAATAAWMRGDPVLGRELATRGIEVAGGERATAAAGPLETRGDIALVTGDLAAALAAYRAGGELAAPATAARAIALANQALALAYGDDPDAWPTARRAVAEARASGNPTAVAMARYAEGEAAADSDPTAALDALDEARRVAARVGNRLVTGVALTATVALRGRHGPPAAALALYRDALAHWRATGSRALLATALRNLVILLARTGRDREAVALAATVQHDAPTPTYGAEAGRIDRALAAARRRLGPAGFDAAWAAGATRTIDEAASDHW
jgi:predicted ATPase/DNA-binding SARP family transcriptional activator